MDKQVIFEIGGQYYGIDSMKVTSIGTAENMTYLPGAPANVLGIINLRGSWCAVYSLHKKFGLQKMSRGKTQFIYVNTKSGLLGIEVDSVMEIAEVGEDYQSNVPFIVQSAKTHYALGIVRHKGELVTLVNPDGILSPAEAAQLERCLKLHIEEEARAEKERELQKALEEARRKEEEKKAQEEAE